MTDYEQLGLFYLGKPYDLAARERDEGFVLYDSRDLLTHAVCVGMTGSGKTGLCITLLEEAALDRIPVIAIDPKGDVANVLLTFPNLAPADFEPWVNPDDAARAGLSVEEFARREAEKWRTGLAEWQQDGDRIRRLRAAADLAVYTPGSSAGLPVSMLSSFAAPAPLIRDDAELLSERVETAATGLLTLAGIEADPVRSRDHVLVATILSNAWKAGTDLDLAAIIQQIQKPPIARVGVLDLDAFYPPSERFGLAMRLNQLLAAPGFEAWLTGEALNVDRLLHGPDGRPRVSIFSIAHLDDNERMFFVSLLLNEVLAWMRVQTGTNSLRALLYMDEIFGYFPPVANPPPKRPLITLLKQARAFGVGVVLATQNPVDLDYKGLSNAGTWFLGRLQTDRDKARVLDGLEGVSASAVRFNRAAMEQTLAGLGNRVFLLHNVHDESPIVFQTRWAMSYLRGPLTRDQIRALMAPRKAEAAAQTAAAAHAAPPAPGAVPAGQTLAPAAFAASSARDASAPPVLPPDVPVYFAPARASDGAGGVVRYEPTFFGAARLHFADPKREVDVTRDVAFLFPLTDGPVPLDWDAGEPTGLTASDLETEPAAPATFGDLPAAAAKARSYEKWRTEFSRWLFQTQKLELWKSASVNLISRPGESERDFRVRVQDAAREKRDQAVAAIRQKYAAKHAGMSERLRRARQAVQRESEQVSQQKVQTAVSFGATILGAILGRKTVSSSTLGRATTTARGMGRASKEAQDVERAQATVAATARQLADLEAQIQAAVDAVRVTDPLMDSFEPIALRPRKTGISVQLAAFVWRPHSNGL